MRPRYSGIIAAPFTPFHPDGALNLDVIPDYVRLLRDNGVRAAFVCGTTGEGPSLTLEERFRVSNRWVQCSDHRLPVIVHVGHTTLENARRLTEHAAAIGADAVSAVAPFFFRPRTAVELVDWCEAVASAAPQLPFYYYHIPSMTGVHVPVREFLEKASGRIPSLAGVKYTDENLEDFAECLNFGGGQYELLFGRDELLMEGLSRNAQGAVGSTYNYAAPLYLRLIAALREGRVEEARHLQDQAVRMIEICNSFGVTHLAASKSLMKQVGVDCGPVRLPLSQPSRAQQKALLEKLSSIGFGEFSCRPATA